MSGVRKGPFASRVHRRVTNRPGTGESVLNLAATSAVFGGRTARREGRGIFKSCVCVCLLVAGDTPRRSVGVGEGEMHLSYVMAGWNVDLYWVVLSLLFCGDLCFFFFSFCSCVYFSIWIVLWGFIYLFIHFRSKNYTTV